MDGGPRLPSRGHRALAPRRLRPRRRAPRAPRAGPGRRGVRIGGDFQRGALLYPFFGGEGVRLLK